jgi:two-component system chemotaxis response regulator CheY
MRQWLGARLAAGTDRMTPHDPTILVADDNGQTLALVRRALRDLGFTRVLTASHGYMALALVKKNPIDLIILDWDLSRLDGVSLLQAVRSIPRMPVPKTIMMTACTDRGALEHAANLGVDQYLVKPFTGATLRQKLEAALGPRTL